MTLTRFRRDEAGFVVPTAVIVLFIILTLGLVVLQNVDFQSRQTGHEVAGEAAFNLAESALEAEAFQIQQQWPNTAAQAYPICTQASASAPGCPGTTVTNSFNSTYAGVSFANPTWKVQVVDDTGISGNGCQQGPSCPAYYSDGLLPTAVSWDSNADQRLWVRAEATVWGQRKIVVAQMARQLHTIATPADVITAGSVTTSNNGNKVIIESLDLNAGLSSAVKVRCADAGLPSTGDPCLGWNSGKGQLDPAGLGAYQQSYVDPNGNYATLSAVSLAQLRTTAIAYGAGHYYNGSCPASLTGLVFVENVPGGCSMNGGTWNSDAAPGALIFADGTLDFNGNINYTGVIYMANAQGTIPLGGGPCTTVQQNLVLTVHGAAAVHGGVFVDKCGLVDAGSAKNDIVYDHAAFGGLQAYSTPALAKNTFRIVPNS